VPLAVDDMDDHALAVDVGDLDPGELGAAHTGSVKNHQQRALKQTAAGVAMSNHPDQDWTGDLDVVRYATIALSELR